MNYIRITGNDIEFHYLKDTEMDVFKLPEGRPLSAGRFISHIRYELATHTVKVRRTGVLSDVVKLWDLQGTQICP